MAAHPPGLLEYQEALGPQGHYGRWLRAKPVAIQLGDTIFLHAGIPPGSYKIRAWHEALGELDRNLTIVAGRDTTVNFDVGR